MKERLSLLAFVGALVLAFTLLTSTGGSDSTVEAQDVPRPPHRLQHRQ